MSVYNNQIILIGNLCKIGEVRKTTSGSVCNFTLAVYRNGKGDSAVTDFISCIAWHNLARGIEQIDKGTRLIVIGSIVTRSYEKDGEKKYITEILAREIGIDISVKKEVIDEEVPF